MPVAEFLFSQPRHQEIEGTKIISLFNHKGGVGKTSTTFSLGWKLAELGYRVLLVDADPQCNLTGMLVDPGLVSFPDESIAIETFYERYPNHTLRSALAPVIDPQLSSTLGFQPYKLEPALFYPVHRRIEFVPEDRRDSLHCTEVPQTLFMVAGHPDISMWDTKVTIACEHPQAISGSENVVGLIYNLLQRTGAEGRFDYILCDLSPAANTLNKLFVMSSHFHIIPSSPDYYSLMAMRKMADLLPEWDDWMQDKAAAARKNPNCNLDPPTHKPILLGFTIQLYAVTTDGSGEPARGYRKWMDAIRNEYVNSLLPTLKSRGMCLPILDNIYHELAGIRNFQSAGTASAAHIPVFALNTALTRATTNSSWAFSIVPTMIGVFHELANRVINNWNNSPPQYKLDIKVRQWATLTLQRFNMNIDYKMSTADLVGRAEMANSLNC